MAEPFLSEIRIFSFNFAPKGWAQCNGQFLPINQNQALFALVGTTYGGNGQTTFALPDLRGRLAMHTGNGHNLGEAAGSEAVTLNINQLPQHIHFANASTVAADSPVLGAGSLAAFNNGYRAFTAPVSLHPSTISNTGGSQAHNNMSPYNVVNFCIALQGIFPSQN